MSTVQRLGPAVTLLEIRNLAILMECGGIFSRN